MHIKTIAIAVNYLDLLSYTWDKNQKELEDYTVITDSKDTDTHKFCNDNGINLFVTDSFYSNNNKFSKSNALNDFFASLKPEDLNWILLLDADIVLNNTISIIKRHYKNQTLDSIIIPNDISVGNGIPLYIGSRNKNHVPKLIYNYENKTNIHGPNDIHITECLFSCGREVYENKTDYEFNKFKRENCFFYGYFHLFHVNSILDTMKNKKNVFNHYSTAAEYDMDFSRKYWAFLQKKTLNLSVHHLGPIGANWTGRKTEKWS